MDKANQFTWRLLAASVCLLTVSQVARADSLDEQRNRYAQIKQAWDNRQMDVVEQMMPGLKNYPLYPYLEYRQITDDLMNHPTAAPTPNCLTCSTICPIFPSPANFPISKKFSVSGSQNNGCASSTN